MWADRYAQANESYRSRFWIGVAQTQALLKEFYQDISRVLAASSDPAAPTIVSVDPAQRGGVPAPDTTPSSTSSGVVSSDPILLIPNPRHPNYSDWVSLVRRSSSNASQVWQGLDWYRFPVTDPVRTDRSYDPAGRPLEIGMPHGYRMWVDGSDHSLVSRLPPPFVAWRARASIRGTS